MTRIDPAEVETVFASERSAGVVPEVTVAVSLHEYEHYVEETLESLRAQTLRAIDLVVVDDSSRDRSAEVVRAWMERHGSRFEKTLLLRHRRNRGPGAARNTAFARARTERVFVLDADDPVFPRCLERHLEALAHSGAGFAYSYIACFDGHHRIWNRWPWDVARLRSGPLVHVTALVAKDVWRRAGGYDEDPGLVGWEDHDFWLRVAAAGDWGILVPEILGQYRIHEDSASRLLTSEVHVDILWDRIALKHPALFLSRGRELTAEPHWTGLAHEINAVACRADTLSVRGWVSAGDATGPRPVSLLLASPLRRYCYETWLEPPEAAGTDLQGFSACLARKEIAPGDYDLGILVGEPPEARAVLTDVRLKLKGAPGPAAPKATILLYHRVAPPDGSDPNDTRVTPEAFRSQLVWLKDTFRIVSLERLCAAIAEERVPDGCVAITFDDGHACNMDTAVPILRDLQVPATFLITAGSIDGGGELLADELWRILQYNSEVARVELRLDVDGAEHRWWPSHATADYHEVFRLLRSLPGGLAASHLKSLQGQTGIPLGARSTHRPLTREDVRAIARCELFEVGSHGLTHTSLAHEEPSTQRRELVDSKALLEEIVGRSVRSFAYPYGGVEDFTFRTAASVEEAGYVCALSTFPAAASSSSDLYRLPRLHVKEWDAPALARRVSRLTIR